MVIRLRHVVKLGETLFDSGARLVVLGRFHCSRQGDVRTPGMDFSNVPPSVARNPLSRDAITPKPPQTSPFCAEHLSLAQTGSKHVLPRTLTPKQKKYNCCDLAVDCFVHGWRDLSPRF
jgi:hypothetical protein